MQNMLEILYFRKNRISPLLLNFFTLVLTSEYITIFDSAIVLSGKNSKFLKISIYILCNLNTDTYRQINTDLFSQLNFLSYLFTLTQLYYLEYFNLRNFQWRFFKKTFIHGSLFLNSDLWICNVWRWHWIWKESSKDLIIFYDTCVDFFIISFKAQPLSPLFTAVTSS